MSYSTSDAPFSLVPSARRSAEPNEVVVLVAFLAISAAVAVFGSATTIASVDGWYVDAEKVAWSPPNWLFGPVWTLLYVAMSVAAWLVWRRRRVADTSPALSLYVAQLFLNSVWTPVFFGGYELIGPAALWLGVGIILLLDVSVIVTIWAFRPISRGAALLLVPYLAWILYATTLNLGVALLNG